MPVERQPLVAPPVRRRGDVAVRRVALAAHRDGALDLPRVRLKLLLESRGRSWHPGGPHRDHAPVPRDAEQRTAEAARIVRTEVDRDDPGTVRRRFDKAWEKLARARGGQPHGERRVADASPRGCGRGRQRCVGLGTGLRSWPRRAGAGPRPADDLIGGVRCREGPGMRLRERFRNAEDGVPGSTANRGRREVPGAPGALPA